MTIPHVENTLLITGGTGTFGRACLKELSLSPEKSSSIQKIIIFSRDEKKQWDMAQEFSSPAASAIRYFLGDVRDKERLKMAFDGVDFIIHAAALKQVPALEYNPIEAIKTNILGTQNVINAALECGVSKVLLLSTDKAVNPINLYGATKLCAEKLMIASNVYGKRGTTKFAVVRYGNVMGSRGSVAELFEKQKQTGRLTLTDKRMTRFWVQPEDAVRFTLSCLNIMEGGEIFVPKLQSSSILDMAMNTAPDCHIEYIGRKKGEKIHETLISEHESLFAEEMDNCFVIRNFGLPVRNEEFEYSSGNL